jgi:hypothetical protein
MDDPTIEAVMAHEFVLDSSVPWKESFSMEFKDWKPFPTHTRFPTKTVCAFLNRNKGGCLVFGVRDDGVVTGVEWNVDRMKLLVDNNVYWSLLFVSNAERIPPNSVAVVSRPVSPTRAVFIVACKLVEGSDKVMCHEMGNGNVYNVYERYNASTRLVKTLPLVSTTKIVKSDESTVIPLVPATTIVKSDKSTVIPQTTTTSEEMVSVETQYLDKVVSFLKARGATTEDRACLMSDIGQCCPIPFPRRLSTFMKKHHLLFTLVCENSRVYLSANSSLVGQKDADEAHAMPTKSHVVLDIMDLSQKEVSETTKAAEDVFEIEVVVSPNTTQDDVVDSTTMTVVPKTFKQGVEITLSVSILFYGASLLFNISSK